MLFTEHVAPDLLYRAWRVHNPFGEFTGITKIERRPGPVGTKHEIHYVFQNKAYKKRLDALLAYREAGMIVKVKGKRR